MHDFVVHFSAYQVIVHEVSDENEDLPADYGSNIGDYKNALQKNLKYYVTAELKNDPVYEDAWNFSVGDGEEKEGFINEKLQRGKMYAVYQRAITYDEKVNDICTVPASTIQSIAFSLYLVSFQEMWSL